MTNPNRPYPIPASKMPKGAKVALGQAVYRGWLWTFKPTGKHWGKRGGVYVPTSPVPK